MKSFFSAIKLRIELLSDARKWFSIKKTGVATLVAFILSILAYRYDILNFSPILKGLVLVLPFLLMLTSFLNIATSKNKKYYFIFLLLNAFIISILFFIDTGKF
jgi:hypothetical protein